MNKTLSILVTAAAVSLLLFSFSCSSTSKKTASDQKKGNSYYQLGLAAWNEGDYIKARREFSKAIEVAPDMAHYYNHLGMVNLQMGNLKDAEKDFRKSLDIDKTYLDPHNNLGVLYTKQEKYEKALEELNAIRSNPMYPFPHFVETNIGVVYRLQKKHDMAEKAFKAALKMKGTHCEAYKELGLLYDEMGMHKNATESYLRCLEYCPYHVEALYRGAVKLLSEGKEKQGAVYLQRCLEIETKNVKQVQIPFLKECASLAGKMDVKANMDKFGDPVKKEKKQINAD